MMTELDRNDVATAALASELQCIRELTQTCRHDDALAASRSLLLRMPLQREALYFSGLNLRRLDRPGEALDVLAILERAYPRYSLTFQEQGHCLVSLGDSTRAIDAFERAVQINPALIASWSMLEELLTAAGQHERALAASRHLSQLRELPADIVEAGSLFCDGAHRAAERLLLEHIARDARHVEALRLLGRIALARGANEQAEALFYEVVKRAPSYAAARLDLVRTLIERQKYQPALAELEAQLIAAPSDFDMRFLQATALAGLGRHDEAVPVFRELAAQEPARNQTRIVLGHSLKALGRTAEAVAAYQDASRGEADVGDAYWSLANLKTFHFCDDDIARMREIEARPDTLHRDRVHLCFALGKALEDRADHAASCSFYARGNALVRSRSTYRASTVNEDVRRLCGVFSPEFFSARNGGGAAGRDPIFIVGLPRSGSTLVEQILATHPAVDGTHELHQLPRMVAELHGGGANGERAQYPDRLPGLGISEFARLGRQYLDETRVYRRGRPRFIDKMPNNFWHVGLIHLILPNAVIIDVRREPMACCVSNLKQFYARGQLFSYAIDDIANYYRAYLEMMRHWDEVLPGRVLRVSYEDLVDDCETSVRRILAHCGLPFEAACLAFHANPRAVNTPSSEQVRMPLFRDGLVNWRQFDAWLGPLRDHLGDALERYRD